MDEDGFKLKNARIAIVGLGLMGASLAMDLHGSCSEIIGISRSRETLDFALQQGIVDRVADFDPSVECELMVLAAPVRTIIRQLNELRDSMPGRGSRRTIVLDLGSTKTEIVRSMKELPARFDPVGGHPMCGKEVSGIRNAEIGLYRNKIFVLTPLERTSSGTLEVIEELIGLIGAVPLFLTPEQQDNLVALTSHLPYLIASALMRTAQSRKDQDLWKVAASGFRDTSRLAASEVTMMIDILLTNRAAVLKALHDFRGELKTLQRLVEEGDEEQLREALVPVQQKRSTLFVREN